MSLICINLNPLHPRIRLVKIEECFIISSMYFAKLRTSISMHNDQEYGKSIMTSHEIIDRDKGAKMLFNLYATLILYLCLNIVFY